jgi:hypothetical protein
MSGNRGGGYTPPPNGHYGGRRGGGIGIAVGVIAFILLYMLFFRNGGVGGGPVTASTVEREALPPGLVNETGYYTDELREIGNGSELTSGMKNFYRKTGVQPYLYTVSNINGDFSPSDAQFDQFADAVYDELFTDEAHYLMVFFQAGGNNMIWHWYGEQAATILDAEALDIIEDYVVRYYLDESISVERAFSKAFNDAGERIMSVTRSPWIPVLIVLGVLAALVIAFLWWKAHKKQKNLEAEQAQKIFETPLETFGDIEAEERAKKYEDEE